jgi:hypothetical protein
VRTVNDTLEYLKIGFAFSGALLGAIVGAPLVELFKDRIGAKRQWENQRNEIVSTIRLILGILNAFDNVRKQAFGKVALASTASLEISPVHFARLKKFDFTAFNDSVVKLSALHPEESKKSAAAQRLIEYLFSLKSYFECLQVVTPISVTRYEDKTTYLSLTENHQEFLKASDDEFRSLRRFLKEIYAQRMGIDRYSFTLDQEISKFEMDLANFYVEEAKRSLLEEYQKENSVGDDASARTG